MYKCNRCGKKASFKSDLKCGRCAVSPHASAANVVVADSGGSSSDFSAIDIAASMLNGFSDSGSSGSGSSSSSDFSGGGGDSGGGGASVDW